MPKRFCSIWLLTLFVLSFAACEGEKQADVASLTKPLPTAPVATPDARITDLNRVVVGATAPDFELEDVNGKLVSLANYRGKKAVVLVFYRGYF